MIVVIAICIMLIMVILSQNPKGGGLSSTFGGGGSQMFGVQRTNNFLDRATWTLSILIAVVIILASVMLPRKNQSNLPNIPTQEQTIPQTTDAETNTPATSETTEAPATE